VREFLRCTIKPEDTSATESKNTRCTIFAEGADESGWLQFDVEDMIDIQRLKCVVIGRTYKRLASYDKEYYVLAVKQRLEGGHDRDYERVGVGAIQGRCISFNGQGVMSRIV
jgi:hypothetical protein